MAYKQMQHHDSCYKQMQHHDCCYKQMQHHDSCYKLMPWANHALYPPSFLHRQILTRDFGERDNIVRWVLVRELILCAGFCVLTLREFFYTAAYLFGLSCCLSKGSSSDELLCIVHCASFVCSSYSVSYTVYRILHIVYCVSYTVYRILYIVYCVSYNVYRVLCIVYSMLRCHKLRLLFDSKLAGRH